MLSHILLQYCQRKYLNKSAKFYVTGYMMSDNQILVNSASNMDFHFFFFFSVHQQKHTSYQ